MEEAQSTQRAEGSGNRHLSRRAKFTCLLLAFLIFLGSGLHLRRPQEQDNLAALPEALKQLYARNPETAAFIENYPGTDYLNCTIDLSEETAGQDVPLLLQWDLRWGYTPYGGDEAGDLLALTGCGPTALSMAIIALTGDTSSNPKVVAEYALSAGYCVPDNGSAWTLISEGCAHFGLKAREIPLWESSMADALQSGELIICCVGPGDFTNSGHFILLCAYQDGAFEIRDPNSRANSEKYWTYETGAVKSYAQKFVCKLWLNEVSRQ